MRAVEGKTKLEVVLSSNQADAFKEALTKDFDSIATSLGCIDARNSTAYLTADSDAIFAAVEKSKAADGSMTGFTYINATVHRQIRFGLGEIASKALAELPPATRGTSGLLTGVAVLLKHQGKLSQAEKLFIEARGAFEQSTTHGPSHPKTLSAISNLASVYHDQGKLSEAKKL